MAKDEETENSPRSTNSEQSETNESRVRVLVRLRPKLRNESSEPCHCLSTYMQQNRVILTSPELDSSRKQALFDSSIDRNPTRKEWSFGFDGVVGPEAGQSDVFQSGGVLSMVRATLNGFHSTILAYGQTGSGKTYTMDGLSGDDALQQQRSSVAEVQQCPTLAQSSENQNNNENDDNDDVESRETNETLITEEDEPLIGLTPRVIECLFESIRERQYDSRFVIRCSFVQLYKEQVYDLLGDDAKHTNMFSRKYNKTGLKMKWDSNGGFYLSDLTTVECSTPELLLETYNQGCKHKFMGSHDLNQASSRSHCLFTIYVTRRPVVDQQIPADDQGDTNEEPSVMSSRLTLVDLAGSERVRLTRASGATLKEATSINKSLFVLRKVILSLSNTPNSSSAHQKHVPYRDSKLTSLLQHSLGGSSYTLIVACLAPSDKHFEENLSTLSYAARASTICNRPTRNEDKNTRIIRSLRAQVKDLKAQLAIAQKSVSLMQIANSNPEHPLPHKDDATVSSKVKIESDPYKSNTSSIQSAQKQTISASNNQSSETSSQSAQKQTISASNNQSITTSSQVSGVLDEQLRAELLESIAMVKAMHNEQLELRERLEEEQTNANAQNRLNRVLQQENSELREREQMLFQMLMESEEPSAMNTLKQAGLVVANSTPDRTMSPSVAESTPSNHPGIRSWLAELDYVRQENDNLRDQLQQYETVGNLLHQQHEEPVGQGKKVRNAPRFRVPGRSSQTRGERQSTNLYGGTKPFRGRSRKASTAGSRFPVLETSQHTFTNITAVEPHTRSTGMLIAAPTMMEADSTGLADVRQFVQRSVQSNGGSSNIPGRTSPNLIDRTWRGPGTLSNLQQSFHNHVESGKPPPREHAPHRPQFKRPQKQMQSNPSTRESTREEKSNVDGSIQTGYGHLSVNQLKSLLSLSSNGQT